MRGPSYICIAAMLCGGLLSAPGAANAGWPLPAEGKSASGDPEVLFTFDDGPHESRTGKIMDVLAEHDMKAVFFWVGHRVDKDGPRSDKRRKLVQRALDEGHIVGNHTMTHRHLCSVNKKRAAAELDKNHKIYEQLTGMPVAFYRTPYGDYCRRLKNQLKARGWKHMHWDIDPREWMRPNVGYTTNYVTSRLRRLKGRAVVLMHDTKATSVSAFRNIARWIDKENARRRKAGKRPIRVISGSDLIIEQRDPPLRQFAIDTGTAAWTELSARLSQLIPGRPQGPVASR